MIAGAVTAVDGSGPGHTPSTRVQTEPPPEGNRSATPVPTQTETAAKAVTASAGEHALHVNTRVALDSKTLRAYIQTVTDEPAEKVIHTYPAPGTAQDPNRLIIVA